MNGLMSSVPSVTRLVDIIFPADCDEHGVLLGSVGLAHMDKLAFVVAARHARSDFVTASCESIEAHAPARLGEVIELSGRLIRIGGRSLSAEVELVAEATATAQRRLCSRGVFNMVAVGKGLEKHGGRLPPVAAEAANPDDDLRMVELIFPAETSHLGTLHSGRALAAMGKAAFVAATRHCRKPVVTVAVQKATFESQIQKGEIVEFLPQIMAIGKTSITVDVDLWAEHFLTGRRRRCAHGSFVLVAMDARHRPTAVLPSAAA